MKRKLHEAALAQLFRTHPIVAILGPRQVGKTTLARQFAERRGGAGLTLDLESPDDLVRLDEPTLALGAVSGLVVLDEIQRRPDLFPVLRVLADRPKNRARFLVLGSASPALLRQSSETLAGRIAYYQLPGFSLPEVGTKNLARLWLRGGFPRSYLAADEKESWQWREHFVRSFLERDIPQLGLQLGAVALRRFWTMIAHHHGQIWNASEIAGSLGISAPTVRHYLDTLVATFVVRQLQPWFENLGKRQVKAAKVYVTDSGLLHTLIGIRDAGALDAHPKLGSSWEGFVVGQIVQHLGALPEECFFWSTHQGAELDLLVVRGSRRLGFEVKRTTAPQVTKSMRIALADLKLESLDVIHAGEATFAIGDRARAVAARRMLTDIEPLE
jgi:predicted AAA+ superfamily ATPase